MKVGELRALADDELDTRLRSARRELYELRFKHAVGQLENASQLSKVRHDIARIMTVRRERDFGILVQTSDDEITEVAPVQAKDEGFEPEDEGANVATAVVEPEPETSKPKRSRKSKSGEEA
jgi:large subunit ribosomal protein L29